MMSKKACRWGLLAGLCMTLLSGDAFGAASTAKPSLWQRTKSYASGVKQRVSTRLGTIKTLAMGDKNARDARITELRRVKLQLEGEKNIADECNRGGIQRTILTLNKDMEALEAAENPGALKSLLASTAQSLVTSKEVLAATAAGVCYYYRAPLATGVGATSEAVKKAVKTYTPEPVKRTVSKYVVRPANKYVAKPIQKNIIRPVTRKYRQVTGAKRKPVAPTTGWEKKEIITPKFTQEEVELMAAAAVQGGFESRLFEGVREGTSYIYLPGATAALYKLENLSFMDAINDGTLDIIARAASLVLKLNGKTVKPETIIALMSKVNRETVTLPGHILSMESLLIFSVHKIIPDAYKDISDIVNRIMRMAVMLGFR